MKDTYPIRPDNRELKPHPDSGIITSDKVFFALLNNQICIIGPEWQVMKTWRKEFKNYSITEFFETKKKVTNSHLKTGVMSLSQFIEFNPAEYYAKW